MKKFDFITRLISFSLVILLCITVLINGIEKIKNDTTEEDFAYLQASLEGVIDEDGCFHHENIPEELMPEWTINKENGNTLTFSEGTAKVSFNFNKEGKLSDMFEISTRQQFVTGTTMITLFFSLVGIWASMGIICTIQLYKKNK